MVIRPDKDYLAELGDLESKSYLMEPSQLRDRTIARINAGVRGLRLPFDGVPLVRMAPGRWTLWSGTSHAGKTQMLRFTMLNAMLGPVVPTNENANEESESCLFISLEEEPEEVLMEFIYLCWGCRPKLTNAMIDWVLDLLEGKLWIFNHTGFMEPNVAFGAVIYAARELNVKHWVLDSLMRLKLRKDDWEGQREIGDTIGRICRQTQTHGNFVVHPNKRGTTTELMDMTDVGGAQELVGQADSIVTIQRAPTADKLRKDWGIYDEAVNAVLQVMKQRGAWNLTGLLQLYYHREARQWGTRHSTSAPRYFLPREAYEEHGIRIPRQTSVADMFGKK